MEDHITALTELTADIVAAYLSKNTTSASDVPALINTIFHALRSLGEPEPKAPETIKLTPAQIRKSITPDALISFEDGRPYKVLKRHLTTLGMTLADYKAKWGLPKDYPTTAASYSARRSEMAKALGLGQVRKKTAASPPKRLGRSKKAEPEPS
jgi:predicted transcriptional regulator